MRIRVLVLTACLAAGVSLTGATGSAPGAGPDAVIAWNANAGEAVVAACFLGGFAPQEARMYAMMHVAVHDALNAIDRRSRPLRGEPRCDARDGAGRRGRGGSARRPRLHAVETGTRHGEKIGRRAVSHVLRPVHG